MEFVRPVIERSKAELVGNTTIVAADNFAAHTSSSRPSQNHCCSSSSCPSLFADASVGSRPSAVPDMTDKLDMLK